MKTEAYAKINLYLDIVGRRADGYHLLEMINTTVSLCDYVCVEKAEGITCVAGDIPQEKNICYKAAKLFFESTGIKGGADIRIEKHIPSEAGLGGGSADAAETLKSLNLLYGSPLSENGLLKLGERLGADVPFALFGGTALVTGTGEIMKRTECRLDKPFVIVKPGGGVNTARAFALSDSLEKKSAGSFEACAEAVAAGNVKKYAKCAVNSLEAAGYELCPSVKTALEELKKTEGCLHAMMTGSGSAVFGLFENEELADFAAEKIKKTGFDTYSVKKV